VTVSVSLNDEPKFARKNAAVHVSLPSDSIVKQRIRRLERTNKRRTALT
jgi:hypothetical protein